MSTYVLTNSSRVKTLNGITSTEYDAYIELTIPMIIDDIKNYCKNTFAQKGRYVYDSNMSFSSANSEVIPSSTSDNFQEEFIAGDTIYILGSNFNDGFYSLGTVNTTSLVVNESFVTESTNVNTIIYRVDFPSDIEKIAADMIGYNISMLGSNRGVNSERIGDYSITYSGNMVSVGANSYPRSAIGGLNKHRKAGLK